MWEIEFLIVGLEEFRNHLLRLEERMRNLYAEDKKGYRDALIIAEDYKEVREQLDIWCNQRYIERAKDFCAAHKKLVDIFTNPRYNDNGTLRLDQSDVDFLSKKLEEPNEK